MTTEVIDPGEWSKPLPDPDGEATEYFAACARGQLLVQECTACGHRQLYPRAWCTECGGEPAWLLTAGVGTVNTFTVVHQNGQEPFKGEVPYVVAMIELAEGPMMMGNVTGCEPSEVHIDMPVEVYMVRVAPEIGIPYWRPVGA